MFIYRKEDPAKGLGDKLRRIFVERGVDFFDKNLGRALQDGVLTSGLTRPDLVDNSTGQEEESSKESHQPSNRAMTAEELFKMRMEILPQL